MFARYTAEAKRAIYFAHVEAVHRDEASISVGDLLVGLTGESGNRACKIAQLKENAVALRAGVNIPHLPTTAWPYTRKSEIPLDDNAKKALAYAAEESDYDLEFWIDSDHLLRGLLRFPNQAGDSLMNTGVGLEILRSASLQHRKEFPPEPAPRGAKLKAMMRKYRDWILVAGALLIILLCLAYRN